MLEMYTRTIKKSGEVQKAASNSIAHGKQNHHIGSSFDHPVKSEAAAKQAMKTSPSNDELSSTESQHPTYLKDNRSILENTVQLKKISTHFGIYETKKFEEVDENQHEGVDIHLTFTPAEGKTNSKKIGLTQTVKTEFHDPNERELEVYKSRKVPEGQEGEGTRIDRLPSRNNPVYGAPLVSDVENTPAPQKATNYELGYGHTQENTWKSKDAELWDRPYAPYNERKSIAFETAAHSLEGSEKGKFYGSVKWGYKANEELSLEDIELANAGGISNAFKNAITQWNKGSTAKYRATRSFPDKNGKSIPKGKELSMVDGSGSIIVFLAIKSNEESPDERYDIERELVLEKMNPRLEPIVGLPNAPISVLHDPASATDQTLPSSASNESRASSSVKLSGNHLALGQQYPIPASVNSLREASQIATQGKATIELILWKHTLGEIDISKSVLMFLKGMLERLNQQ